MQEVLPSLVTASKLKNILKFHQVNSCLKDLYIKDHIVSEEIQRHIGMYFASRWGKSIIHTNLTETLNHHSCDTFTHGIKFDIPLQFGFASHFRTVIDGFLEANRIFPFKNIVSDAEYYIFLCHTLGLL